MAIQTLALPKQTVLHAGLTADDVDPPSNFGGHHKIFGRKVRCADTLQGGSLQWRAGSTLAGGARFLGALAHSPLHQAGWLDGQPQMLLLLLCWPPASYTAARAATSRTRLAEH